MSLSTLLEAAKYLDYLDSNGTQQSQHQNHEQQQQLHPQLQFQTQQPIETNRKSAKRQRSQKKNKMIAMSLPTSMQPTQLTGHSAPIPLVSGQYGQGTSLSSSLKTGSPTSSFASTVLYCSKASGEPSVSSSAASSLSSSDSSSSSGEILMGENDFSTSLAAGTSKNIDQLHNSNHHDYHITHQNIDNGFNNSSNNRFIARYIAATSAGPQLVTVTTDSSVLSASAPINGSIRAGHVIHAANNGALLGTSPGANLDPLFFPMTRMTSGGGGGDGGGGGGGGGESGRGGIHQQSFNGDFQTFNLSSSSYSSDKNLNSGPPLTMARVHQPTILNPMSPSTHNSIMAFQQAAASSPTSSSSSYSRHRELHKTLEKNRRAHLRHCFELLKAELPSSECADKKTSHINIIKSAIRHVSALRQQEFEIDNELQRLTKIKNELTETLSKMRLYQSQDDGLAPHPSPLSPPPSQQREEQPKQEQQVQQQQQQPAAEQQLSFLLSQSKID